MTSGKSQKKVSRNSIDDKPYQCVPLHSMETITYLPTHSPSELIQIRPMPKSRSRISERTPERSRASIHDRVKNSIREFRSARSLPNCGRMSHQLRSIYLTRANDQETSLCTRFDIDLFVLTEPGPHFPTRTVGFLREDAVNLFEDTSDAAESTILVLFIGILFEASVCTTIPVLDVH